MTPGREPRSPGHYCWVICALLFFAATINYIDRQVIGILKPTLVKEFGWRDAGRHRSTIQTAQAGQLRLQVMYAHLNWQATDQTYGAVACTFFSVWPAFPAGLLLLGQREKVSSNIKVSPKCADELSVAVR